MRFIVMFITAVCVSYPAMMAKEKEYRGLVLPWEPGSGSSEHSQEFKRPPLLSDQFYKIPKVSQSNHYIWNLL